MCPERLAQKFQVNYSRHTSLAPSPFHHGLYPTPAKQGVHLALRFPKLVGAGWRRKAVVVHQLEMSWPQKWKVRAQGARKKDMFVDDINNGSAHRHISVAALCNSMVSRKMVDRGDLR